MAASTSYRLSGCNVHSATLCDDQERKMSEIATYGKNRLGHLHTIADISTRCSTFRPVVILSHCYSHPDRPTIRQNCVPFLPCRPGIRADVVPLVETTKLAFVRPSLRVPCESSSRSWAGAAMCRTVCGRHSPSGARILATTLVRMMMVEYFLHWKSAVQ